MKRCETVIPRWYTPGVYSYREYNYSGAETPVYIDDPNNPGQKVLGVNGEPLDYETVTKFKRIAKPGNNNKYDKQGVEYTFDFGQIRAIRTSIIVNGAYMQMKNMPDVGVKQLFDLSYNSGKIQINGENVYNPVYGDMTAERAYRAQRYASGSIPISVLSPIFPNCA